MRRLTVRHFDLDQTLCCGQFFDWTSEDGGYRIHASGRDFHAAQQGDSLIIEGVDEAFARGFFALDHDPEAMLKTMPRDPSLEKAFKAFGRLRLLRQDPWECLVAFLLSPVSNQPRIQRNLLALRHATGLEPENMRDEARLRRLGVGFRASFLVSAADVGAGKETLRRVRGVGDKVSDCVMLFAYGDYGSFPIDVWTRRVLRRLYGRQSPDKALRLWAREHFGPWAGYAQQWLYAWFRQEER